MNSISIRTSLKGTNDEECNRKMGGDILQTYEKNVQIHSGKLSNTEIQFSSIILAKIKKYDDPSGKQAFSHIAGGKCKLQRELGNNLTKLQKQFDLATPLLGIHPADTLPTM